MATYASPAAQYISSAHWSSVAAWAASTSYPPGTLIRQQTSGLTVNFERVFVQTAPTSASPTSAGTQPTWSSTSISKGAKVTDGTCAWFEVTGQPGVNGDISTSAPADCPVWTASANPPLGVIIYDSVTSSLQICTTSSGNSLGSVPSFSATAGTVTNDSSNRWTSLGLASGFSPFGAPHARLNPACAGGWAATGQTLYVGSDHAETQASTISFEVPGTTTVPATACCVPTTAAPPTTGATGATVTATSGSSGINIQSGGNDSASFVGISFTAAGTIQLGTDNCVLTFFSCSFNISGTSTASVIGINNQSNAPMICEWWNCSVSFGNISQIIQVEGAKFTWRNTPSNGITGSISPTNLLQVATGTMADVLVEGVDLSMAASVVKAVASGYICIKDCKIGSNVTVASLGGSGGQLCVEVMRADSSGTNYKIETHSGQGDQTTSSSVVRTGGASDGTTPVSHQTVMGLPLNIPFYGIPIDVWNALTGADRTITLYGMVNAASLPLASQFWMNVVYLGAAGSPVGSMATTENSPLNSSGPSLTADTSAWDSAATAWAASTLYAVGRPVKVSSNPGRIFFCTTGGTSQSGSAPSGFGTAVDGGTVTDSNGVVFRAGVRFVTSIVLSSPQPAQVGYMTIYPIYNAAQGVTFFIDPLPVLS